VIDRSVVGLRLEERGTSCEPGDDKDRAAGRYTFECYPSDPSRARPRVQMVSVTLCYREAFLCH